MRILALNGFGYLQAEGGGRSRRRTRKKKKQALRAGAASKAQGRARR
jgi:hypothetical protein